MELNHEPLAHLVDIGLLNGGDAGAPKAAGVALVRPDGVVEGSTTFPLDVYQFLSYEGDFEAVEGPAAGLRSIDIGVTEDSNTIAGDSLQLSGGPGSSYDTFDETWIVHAETFDVPEGNFDQIFLSKSLVLLALSVL